MKKIKLIISVIVVSLIAFGAVAAFTACGDELPELGQVTGLTFDFETGAYAFDGVEDAETYYVKAFKVATGEDGVEREEDLESSSTNKIRGGKTSYKGKLAMSSLTPGAKYNVYVYAEAEEYAESVSAATAGVYVKVFAAPDLGVTATIDGATVTVKLDNDAITDYYDSGADFEIALYKGETKLETKKIVNADIEEEKQQGGGGFPGGGGGFGAPAALKAPVLYDPGGSGGGTKYKASVTFTVTDTAAAYTVTVKVISTNAAAYKSSAESDPFTVTAAVPTPEPQPDQK